MRAFRSLEHSSFGFDSSFVIRASSFRSGFLGKNFRERSSRLGVFRVTRGLVDEHFDDVVGADAFGFGVEVGEDAVAEGGVGDGADVFCADMIPALQEGAGLAGEDEGLAGAGTGAPTDVILDELGRVGLAQARLADEANRVFHYMLGDGDFADEFL